MKRIPAAIISSKAIGPWAEKVEKDSGGRIKVQQYPSMQPETSPKPKSSPMGGCFRSIVDTGCTPEVIVTGSGRKAVRHPASNGSTPVLGNIKSALLSAFRAASAKCAPRALAEFEYRFNRRYDLAGMIPRLSWVALRTPPMPYRLLNWLRIIGNQERL